MSTPRAKGYAAVYGEVSLRMDHAFLFWLVAIDVIPKR